MLQYVVIPKPNHAIALRFKKGRSLRITRSLFRMLTTVEFHYELLFKANEIYEVRRNRMLPAKFEPAEVSILQPQPKPQFRVGG